MKMTMKWGFISGVVLIFLLGCPGPGQAKTRLRVPLYPYIPDAAGDQFKAMAARIEAEFEQEHPDIDLVVNPSCFSDDFYDPEALARSLKGEGECGYDVIETDTVILGELVAQNAVRPWPRLPRNVNFHPAGLAASRQQQSTYGIPHWLCGHFIISRDESVRQARTESALRQALTAINSPVPDMATNMLGSWNLPALYLDAWADRNGGANVASAVTTASYDQAALQSMRDFVQSCESSGSNPCIDGTYALEENFDLPAILFATGQVDATLGYSERLHVILKNLPAGQDASSLKISSAPLAEGSHPILFTDAYFLSVRCTYRCAEAALSFVDYMSRASTFEWLLMSEDAPEGSRVPRYLLPATLDAYSAPKVQADPFYPTLDMETRQGAPFPNSGLLNIRQQMRDDILTSITSDT
ncbi:hypothetical protein JQX13_08095 [Archangium violaceum]|uniref:hypothetical protein n=1 Tax=Archangium violaceum TaxID=83451 RepID=UPI00193BA619|nr:hypothetical protein [Archangium violaceum]QRK10047.1 hypothetical protein JQX13_08095 [Archangium violaceum]